jgi:hypothetical protein
MSIILQGYTCAHCGLEAAIWCFYDCEDEAHFCRDENREECEQRAGAPRADHPKEAT